MSQNNFVSPASKRFRLSHLPENISKSGLNISQDSLENAMWPGWCTIESEPAIFNQLLKDIGIQDVHVEEIYGLDEISLRSLNPAHGLIFLFRWKEESADNIETTCPEDVWFANQVIDNACASLALLNIVYNSDISLGPVLQSFKEYSKELTPPMKGLAVANFSHIRAIHNTFARDAEMVDVDINLADIANKKIRLIAGEEDDSDEVFHFIAYVHVGGALWELDGLKRQPLKLNNCSKDEWLTLVGPSLQERIARYSEGELRFNLLAVVPERPDDINVKDAYYGIAHRRKQNYERFAHKVAMILNADQLSGLLND